jgi:poly(A) polymerase/tRNA nucleotidyltransferase (CCA-adding enzyme)
MFGTRHIHAPRELKDFAATFAEAGYQCYLVGGALRNMALGKPVIDWDVATDATPEQVSRLFRRVIPTGIRHGTVTVLYGKQQIEVTTFRVETGYSDARHPDSVIFTASIEEDLKRRDFTMNAMALAIESGTFVDPHDGLTDIRNQLIRAIGKPLDRFQEDGLRILRAIRFAAQLEFRIEEDTFEAMAESRDQLDSISAERIRDELTKILETRKPSAAFLLMQQAQLMSKILPELVACIDVPQAEPPRILTDRQTGFDVFRHSILACDGAPAEVPEVRMAALLHDIGKAPTYSRDKDGTISFHGHEQVSAVLAEQILTRLRYPNLFIRKVCHLVEQHMFHYEPEWSDAAVRRFLARVGPDALPHLYLLRRADTYGKTGRPTPDAGLDELQRRVERITDADHAITIRDLAVNGNDLHSEAGIPRGPIMGTALQFLLDAVLEDPEQNTRDKLLALAAAFRTSYVESKEAD